MRFQIASLILLKFSRLLDFARLICLLVMYLAMKFSKSLIFFKSNARYLIELWSEIGWKLLFQRSGSIGVFGLYNSWILMTVSSPQEETKVGCLTGTWGELEVGHSIVTHLFIILLLGSAAILTLIAFS